MLAAYIDSSIIVSVLFGEKKSQSYVKSLSKYDELISGSLLEAEVLSAARREGLSIQKAREAVQLVSLYFPQNSLAEQLDQVFSASYVRGADAYHLACALCLDPSAKEIRFATADSKQGEVARKLGFKFI